MRIVIGAAVLLIVSLGPEARATLTRLHFPDNDNSRSQVREVLDFLLRPHSPFDHINSEHVILIDDSTYSEPDEYRATVCFCRVASCSARWPIASFDVDNLPDRPYACSKLAPYLVSRGHYQPAFDTPMEKFGLAEPR